MIIKIWICFVQFFIEQHKINYVRRHTKKIAYDVIKYRICFHFNNFYFIVDELLKNLNENFDDDENTKRNKIHVKFFDNSFQMIESKKFEIFIIRFNVVIVDFQLIDDILIHQLKLKISSFLKNSIEHLAEIHKYHEFVKNFKYVAQHVEKLKIERNESKNKSYSNFYSLIKKEKKQFDNIKNCYKCYQSRHKINDKNAFCKQISWMLKKTKQ